MSARDARRGATAARLAMMRVVREWRDGGKSVDQLLFRMQTTPVEVPGEESRDDAEGLAEQKLLELRNDVLALVSDSDGVAGYHLSGEVASWNQLAFDCGFGAIAELLLEEPLDPEQEEDSPEDAGFSRKPENPEERPDLGGERRARGEPERSEGEKARMRTAEWRAAARKCRWRTWPEGRSPSFPGHPLCSFKGVAGRCMERACPLASP